MLRHLRISTRPQALFQDSSKTYQFWPFAKRVNLVFQISSISFLPSFSRNADFISFSKIFNEIMQKCDALRARKIRHNGTFFEKFILEISRNSTDFIFWRFFGNWCKRSGWVRKIGVFYKIFGMTRLFKPVFFFKTANFFGVYCGILVPMQST